MVAAFIPAQSRLFIVREDWRDGTKFPPTELRDPSIGAWELLRRSNQYALDYAYWHPQVTDVPPVPFPKMSLAGYFCVPEPSPGMTYEQYKAEHPDHFVLPIEDHIRERWGITRLIDPALPADEVLEQHPEGEPNNQLAWLFACTAPDILNPPTHWPTKNYLAYQSLAMLTSGFCTGTEVMVRLDFTGNFEVQVESLRRQIGAFFDGGTRSGSAVVDRRTHAAGQSNFDDLDRESFGDFLAVKPNWNTTPAKLKSIHGVTRMAEVIASLEAGTLTDQIQEKRGSFPRVDVSDLDLSIDPNQGRNIFLYAQEHQRVREALGRALLRYFEWHTFDKGQLTLRMIDQWLDLAYQFVSGDHALIARITPPRSTREKAEKKKSG